MWAVPTPNSHRGICIRYCPDPTGCGIAPSNSSFGFAARRTAPESELRISRSASLLVRCRFIKQKRNRAGPGNYDYHCTVHELSAATRRPARCRFIQQERYRATACSVTIPIAPCTNQLQRFAACGDSPQADKERQAGSLTENGEKDIMVSGAFPGKKRRFPADFRDYAQKKRGNFCL